MKIIDAHLHFVQEPYFNEIAKQAGHLNTEEHLRSEYKRLGFAGGIVMGNRSLDLENHQYPEMLKYCVGLDKVYLKNNNIESSLSLIEAHLQRTECCGIKLYPGYNPVYVYDKMYAPVYRLARRYNKPVAVHMGETASPDARLCYSHPLTLDNAAAENPDVRFVMCHFGNPWLADAAAVISKNKNVAVDLSGLLEGRVNIDQLFIDQSGYLDMVKAWLGYINAWDRVMFGTDWPLVNLEEYVEFIKRLVPKKYWDNVFWKNAENIYMGKC